VRPYGSAMDEHPARDVITRIERTFGRDLDAWLSCFDEPMVVVGADATAAFETRDAARSFFGRTFDALREAGFATTTADRVTVQPIDDTLALVDARFTRRRADGSEMERLGALYLCRRRAGTEEWGVAVLTRRPYADE
jgi:hypothetical protein